MKLKNSGKYIKYNSATYGRRKYEGEKGGKEKEGEREGERKERGKKQHKGVKEDKT